MPGSQTILQRVAYAPAALGVLLFWVGILMAAQRYPSEYDWRFMTVSRLLGADWPRTLDDLEALKKQ